MGLRKVRGLLFRAAQRRPIFGIESEPERVCQEVDAALTSASGRVHPLSYSYEEEGRRAVLNRSEMIRPATAESIVQEVEQQLIAQNGARQDA